MRQSVVLLFLFQLISLTLFTQEYKRHLLQANFRMDFSSGATDDQSFSIRGVGFGYAYRIHPMFYGFASVSGSGSLSPTYRSMKLNCYNIGGKFIVNPYNKLQWGIGAFTGFHTGEYNVIKRYDIIEWPYYEDRPINQNISGLSLGVCTDLSLTLENGLYVQLFGFRYASVKPSLNMKLMTVEFGLGYKL